MVVLKGNTEVEWSDQTWEEEEDSDRSWHATLSENIPTLDTNKHFRGRETPKRKMAIRRKKKKKKRDKKIPTATEKVP